MKTASFIIILLMSSMMSLAQTSQDDDSVSQPVPPQEKVEKQVPAVSDTAPAPSAVVKKDTVKQAAPKKEERPREQVSAPPPVAAKSDLEGAGGLLEIQNGEYLYRRIPDKKFPERTNEVFAGFEVGASIEPAGGEILEPVSRRGLFGLSADATNYMAKGVLFFIILIIVVLYRMRSRTRRSKVHKSFR